MTCRHPFLFGLAAALVCSWASAQSNASGDVTSAGRGAPLLVEVPLPNVLEPILDASAIEEGAVPMARAIATTNVMVGPVVTPSFDEQGNAELVRVGSAFDGATPAGIEPLEIDLYSSKDFYADRELWSDPRYFRCASPYALEGLHGATNITVDIATQNPADAAWGYCDRDYPREAIVSPYKFDSAQAHYEALIDEARGRGGPTTHTYASVPGEWSGRYAWLAPQTLFTNWYGMALNQVPTILSLLTEEYQTRMVQQLYHTAVNNAAQWPGSYCWPEGFMRRYHYVSWTRHIIVSPKLVQILSPIGQPLVTSVYVGREFDTSGPVPRLGEDVPRWYGETIGFWDDDALITWTSNIRSWTSHGTFEFSNKMQTIEVYTPNHDADGRFLGLGHETIFYDAEALVEPIRIVREYRKLSDFDQGAPFAYEDCTQSIFPIEGRATPVVPGAVLEYQVPDMLDRPWARIWEQYFEQDMSRPEEEDIFSFE